MTFFTVNPFDDGYFKDGMPTRRIEKICFRKWKKLHPDLVVLDYNSDEVKEAIRRYPKLYKKCSEVEKEKCVFADVVRLIALTKHEDWCYFDCDLYPIDDFIEGTGLYYNCFMLMNISKQDAEKLLRCYDDNDLPDNLFDIYDKKIIAKSGIQFSQLNAHVLHLSGVDVNPHYMTVADTAEDYEKAVAWWHDGHHNVLKIFRTKKYDYEKHDGVQMKNLYKIRDDKDREAIIKAVKKGVRYFELEN